MLTQLQLISICTVNNPNPSNHAPGTSSSGTVIWCDIWCVFSGWDTCSVWNLGPHSSYLECNDQWVRGCIRTSFGLSRVHCITLLKSGKITGLKLFSKFGLIYFEAGWWKDTEELDVQVKETQLRLFGAKHPVTLLSMGNLTLTYM